MGGEEAHGSIVELTDARAAEMWHGPEETKKRGPGTQGCYPAEAGLERWFPKLRTGRPVKGLGKRG